MDFGTYDTGGFFDEMFEASGRPRAGAEVVVAALASMPAEELARRKRQADLAFLTAGITFNVYGDRRGEERIFPFDLVPRVVEAEAWATIERGLVQRVRALNALVDDLYHEQRIVREGVIPAEVVESSAGWRKECVGLDPPLGVWCHVSGIDLVRDASGTFFVLEDNVQSPSGVSYVLENRQVVRNVLPEVFQRAAPLPVQSYPVELLEALKGLSEARDPTVVVLTPGVHNSAYFEHSYLAQKMGVELVEGGDLVVEGDEVKMRTTKGLQRVDVIYRRVGDDFLDPDVFRADSLLGVRGLMRAYRAGNVALANAPGTGVADDKGVYPYVPEAIGFYLGEKPILPNVPTYKCWVDKEREHVLANLDKLVVKRTDASGGYGMLVGSQASPEERREFAKRVEAEPRSYVAQPTLALSRAPVLAGSGLEGRHVDLRPYVVHGRKPWVLPGGLTRVALRKGSLVVNSSQGGGSKDTWVLPAKGAE